jgi:hypothetical protein
MLREHPMIFTRLRKPNIAQKAAAGGKQSKLPRTEFKDNFKIDDLFSRPTTRV